jgi:pyruvate dehydrogenase E1 component
MKPDTPAQLQRLPDGSVSDIDPQETAEWREAFDSLIQTHGPLRARFILDQLAQLARQGAIGWQPELGTPYFNSIPVDQQAPFPGDLAIE